MNLLLSTILRYNPSYVAPVEISETYGALSRAQPGAGIATTATAIVSGDPLGHWQIGSGRLYPSVAGDTANMSGGPYVLELDNGQIFTITIEANTWDVATQAEWDVIAVQAAATLAGKKIALRNSTAIDTKINGLSGSPFRRVDLRASGVPLTVEGRFGAVGAWAAYCEINHAKGLRGTRGVKFKHLRTTPSAEIKFGIIGEAANVCDDITIEDCWVTGAVGDPFGDYANSANYPMRDIDLISTQGSALASVGNITVKNCFIEWAASGVNIAPSISGKASLIEGNEIRYFYDDGIAVGYTPANCACTVRGNTIYAPMSLPTDTDGAHPDAIRLIGSPTATGDWTNILVENNVIFPGSSRGVQQAILLDDMKTSGGDSGFFFVATVRNNLISNNVIQGVWIGQAKNCVVDNNTVASWNLATANTLSILVGAGSANATTGGGNTVSDNISESYSVVSGSTQTNNVTTGRNGATIAYSTVYTGPTFAPTTRAQAIVLFTPLPAAGGAGAILT